MARSFRWTRFPAIAFALLCASSALAGPPNAESIEGQLDILWGDPPPGSDAPAHQVLMLTEDSGRITEIAISPELAAAHGGFLAWNGRRIRVQLDPEAMPASAGVRPGTRRAQALTLLEGRDPGRGGVFGSQPWVSILCKFADVAAEPENVTYFQDMYANLFGGLDDYWRKQSYGNVDIIGSTAVDWVVLPQNHTFYVPTPGSGTDAALNTLFDDCTEAADPFIDYSNGGSGGFSGINQMFNALLDCCAWGGGRNATLDGVSKRWRVTWEPPWAYSDSSVIAHEMGHGFGLPHSNNFDGDSNPYDSPWDVMSSASGYAVTDPTFGRLGKHHTAYHKERLGWIAPAELLEVLPGNAVTATIDAMAVPSTPNYRMARVPIRDSNQWYTVESRRFQGYDGNIVGNAVIISHVDTTRSEPAWAVDTAMPPANYADNEGTMFRVGETFTSPSGEIVIRVDSATDDGFVVSIESILPQDIFTDGFETGP